MYNGIYFMKMNKSIKKLLLSLSLIFSIVFVGQAYCQDEDYAIVYLIRLKKSTNSTKSYNAWIDDNYIGVMNGNNPVFTDVYTGKWLVFNCAAKKKRVLKLTTLKEKNHVPTIIFNTEKGKRYFVVFDPSVPDVDKQLFLIDNKKGLEYLYKAADEDIIVVDKDILEKVKYEKQYGFLKTAKAVNETAKSISATSPIDKLKINIANKQIDNINHKAIVSGRKEFKSLWSIIVRNSDTETVKNFIQQYYFETFKMFDNINDNTTIEAINKIIAGVKTNENLLIYFSESEDLIYLGIGKQ